MGHIERRRQRRANGTAPTVWRARYRGPDGRERSQSFARKIDAERWLGGATADLRSGVWVAPEREVIAYGRWAEQWMAARAVRLRASSLARDEAYLRTHLAPVFAGVPLGRLTQPMVQEWVTRMAGGGLAPATVHKAYQLLAGSLTAAVAAGSLTRSPCAGVELPRVEREEMRFLTPGEVAQLADTMPPRWRALVLVAAYGGLRVGELAALRRHRVDPLRSVVTVTETLTEVRGRLVTNPPKTRAGRRAVTLPRPVTDALVEHLDRFSMGERDGYVFASRYGGPLRVPAWRRRVWQPAVAAAGLAPLRVHDLRHTAVALWIAAGASLAQVKQRAGHESAAFTIDRYGHLFEGGDAALLDGLAAGFVGPSDGADVLPLRIAAEAPAGGKSRTNQGHNAPDGTARGRE